MKKLAKHLRKYRIAIAITIATLSVIFLVLSAMHNPLVFTFLIVFSGTVLFHIFFLRKNLSGLSNLSEFVQVMLWALIFLLLLLILFLPPFRDEFLRQMGVEIAPGSTSITMTEFLTGIGAILFGFLLFQRNTIQIQNMRDQTVAIRNQTRQVLNEEQTTKNQHFLDGIRIFHEAKDNIDAQLGALFHLQNLALSAPEFRQRVLYFFNWLNRWMIEKDTITTLITKTDKEWHAWKYGSALFPGVDEAKQDRAILLSFMYQDILQQHTRDWERFSVEEKQLYALTFKHLVFPCINFSINAIGGFKQPETNFKHGIFFGPADFYHSRFSGDALFQDATFYGEAKFDKVRFHGKVVNFGQTRFEGRMLFDRLYFEEDKHIITIDRVSKPKKQGEEFVFSIDTRSKNFEDIRQQFAAKGWEERKQS